MSGKGPSIKEQILARRAALVASALGSAVAVNCSAPSLERRGACLSFEPDCNYGVDEEYCDPCDASCRVCLSLDPSGGSGGEGGLGGQGQGGANDGGAGGEIR